MKIKIKVSQKVVREIGVILQKFYLLNQAKENALLVMLIVVYQAVGIVLINTCLIMDLWKKKENILLNMMEKNMDIININRE